MVEQPTDAELMALAKLDDPQAFGKLVERHQTWLKRLLYHLFWNWEEAEDGVQEVFLRVWLARDKYEPKARFTTYLFSVARNYWVNRSTRGKPKTPFVSLEEQFGPEATALLEQLADQAPSPEQQVIRSYEVYRIRRALDDLPEKQRLVFILSHFEDLRYAKIAELLDIPEGTVKSRMAHAVRNLRDRLGEVG